MASHPLVYNVKPVRPDNETYEKWHRHLANELTKAGYGFRQSRRKGLLKKQDLRERLKFCRKIKKHKLGQEFWNEGIWNEGISLYLDGKEFNI